MSFCLKPIRRQDDPDWHAAFVAVTTPRVRWAWDECRWCGEIFQYPVAAGRQVRKYCSPACKREWDNARKRERYAEGRAA